MATTPKKTRNRTPKPDISYTGMTLAQWQAEPELLLYAQRDPHFAMVLNVLTNERWRAQRATNNDVGAAALTGARVEGYEDAIKVLVEMTRGASKPLVAADADYLHPALGENDPQLTHD